MVLEQGLGADAIYFDVGARAERAAIAGEHHCPNGGILLRPQQRVVYCIDQLTRQGISPFRPVQPQDRNTTYGLLD
ncbi:hypothetical protein TUM20985_39180 [Mycobacterium antarcticum]|nr:hypothetical protein TUM20985_39180 [Mycolicibacterium sp. TUM20985]GLP83058.1 hypothetical protein TUM20984_44780 [Mycolicibacterium sp. TUM20984]